MTIKRVQLGVKRKRGELGRRLDHHLLETERNAELAVDEPYAVEFDDRHGALALLDLVERDRLFLGGVTLGGRRGEHLEFDCVGVTLPRTNDRGVQCLNIYLRLHYHSQGQHHVESRRHQSHEDARESCGVTNILNDIRRRWW